MQNKKETKEMERAQAKRRLTVKNGYRWKNGGKEDRRKTKTDDAGLNDDGRLWEVERRGPTTRGVATLYMIRTCLKKQRTNRSIYHSIYVYLEFILSLAREVNRILPISCRLIL